MSAIVAGATGAVGSAVASELVASDHFTRVVALTRRPIAAADFPATWPLMDAAKAAAKLTVVPVDWEDLTVHGAGHGSAGSEARSLSDATVDAFTGHTFALMCLATTRLEAGSAEAFRRVDYDYAMAFARTVSSGRADPDSWFTFHRTKGECERDIIALGFPRTSIFQPGFLDRGAKARLGERIAAFLPISRIPVERVGRAMVCEHSVESSGLATRFNNADIERFCQLTH